MGRLITFWGYIRKYKYVAAFLIFMLILGVLDENSLWVRYGRRAEIAALQHEIDKYQAMYDDATAKLEALQNDPSAVERMARENYLMKRPNEDIFVFGNVDPSQIQSLKRRPLPNPKPAEALPDDSTHRQVAADSLAVAAQQQQVE